MSTPPCLNESYLSYLRTIRQYDLDIIISKEEKSKQNFISRSSPFEIPAFFLSINNRSSDELIKTAITPYDDGTKCISRTQWHIRANQSVAICRISECLLRPEARAGASDPGKRWKRRRTMTPPLAKDATCRNRIVCRSFMALWLV
jgi:hypothetical protein